MDTNNSLSSRTLMAPSYLYELETFPNLSTKWACDQLVNLKYNETIQVSDLKGAFDHEFVRPNIRAAFYPLLRAAFNEIDWVFTLNYLKERQKHEQAQGESRS